MRLIFGISIFVFSTILSANTSFFNSEKKIFENLDVSLGTQFYSDYLSASSTKSQRFMETSFNLSHSLSKKYQINYSLGATKNLEGERKLELSDIKFSLSGLKKTINDFISLTWAPKLNFVFDELRHHNFSQRAAVSFSQTTKISFIDQKLQFSQTLEAQKRFHQYEQSFRGESNTSGHLAIGFGSAFKFTELLNLSIGAKYFLPYAYSGKKREELLVTSASLSYQAMRKVSINMSAFTFDQVLNERGIAKETKSFILSDRTLFSAGLTVSL